MWTSLTTVSVPSSIRLIAVKKGKEKRREEKRERKKEN